HDVLGLVGVARLAARQRADERAVALDAGLDGARLAGGDALEEGGTGRGDGRGELGLDHGSSAGLRSCAGPRHSQGPLHTAPATAGFRTARRAEDGLPEAVCVGFFLHTKARVISL